MNEKNAPKILPLEGGGTVGVTNISSESYLPLEGGGTAGVTNILSESYLPFEGGGTAGVTNILSESKRTIKMHSLLGLCRYNRKNMTQAEGKLWFALRGNKLGFSFRGQQQIGKYIVDFVCLQKKLIIECDGSQHNESVDAERTHFLETEGYTVLRFWNNEVLSNLEVCIAQIQEVLKNCCHPLHTSPLKGEDFNERLD